MTVGKLIARLQQFPPNLEVVASDDLGDGYSFSVENVVRVATVDDDALEESRTGDMVAIIP